MKSFITKLQEKPYESRLRIMWGTVLGVGVVLLVLFVFSIKTTLQGVDGKKLIELSPQEKKALAETQIPYATVERVERTNRDLKIYFNFNNPTDEILNISKLADITLNADNANLNPTNIQDRQGNPFVQKILSRTQNFAVLIFPPSKATTATLTFSQMYLEKDPSNVFQQKLDLNLEELTQSTKVRN